MAQQKTITKTTRFLNSLAGKKLTTREITEQAMKHNVRWGIQRFCAEMGYCKALGRGVWEFNRMTFHPNHTIKVLELSAIYNKSKKSKASPTENEGLNLKSGDMKPKMKRGRPKGSKNKAKASPSTNASEMSQLEYYRQKVQMLEQQLFQERKNNIEVLNRHNELLQIEREAYKRSLEFWNKNYPMYKAS